MKIHRNRGSNFLLALLLAVGAGACNQAGEVTERQMQMSDAKSGNDGEMGNPAMYSNDGECSQNQCGLPQSDEELRRILTPEQYRIMRLNGTERAFANAYWDNKAPGLYVDPISGEVLFSSREKFDSGTGWPSFTAPVQEESVTEIEDRSLGAPRTEVRASKSNSHLGHVFDDGPGPGGLRYCINSASLKFIPVAKLDEEGYGEYKALFGEEKGATEKNATDKGATDKGGREAFQIATFGAGCFWGVESTFRKVKGVTDTAVGYMGGTLDDPTYRDVCSGQTGHAEVLHIQFDPAVVSYESLLELFWKMHDPTTLNRQGPDVGTQYRSAVFYHTEAQAEAARKVKSALEAKGSRKGKIVTEVTQAGTFYRAEEYHQRYIEKQGGTSCHTGFTND